MACFPETIKPGDVVYLQLSCHNISDQELSVPVPDLLTTNAMSGATIEIVNGEQSYPFTIEVGSLEIWMIFGQSGFRWNSFIAIPSHEEKVILGTRIQFPPLEDLHEPFWKELLDDVPPDGKELEIKLTLSGVITFGMIEHSLRQSVNFQPRIEKEMMLIESWYKNSQNNFPAHRAIPRDATLAGGGTFCPDQLIKFGKDRTLTYPPSNQDIVAWCIQIGNRYPSDPNAPTTWQGWKELEESLTPSTMRDEIRLTRILIQYCNTRDRKVLLELAAWFEGMNEIQRTVMAKNIFDLAKECHGNDVLLPLFRDIYHTIRKYDVAGKPERSLQHLRKNLGLIE